MIRSAVRTIREGREVPGDRHCICPWRIPVNHNLLLATFALNEIGHIAPRPAVRASVGLIVSHRKA